MSIPYTPPPLAPDDEWCCPKCGPLKSGMWITFRENEPCRCECGSPVFAREIPKPPNRRKHMKDFARLGDDTERVAEAAAKDIREDGAWQGPSPVVDDVGIIARHFRPLIDAAYARGAHHMQEKAAKIAEAMPYGQHQIARDIRALGNPNPRTGENT